MLSDMGTSANINLAALTRTWQNVTFVGDMVQPSNVAAFTPWLGDDTSCDATPSFSDGASHLGGLLSTDLVRATIVAPTCPLAHDIHPHYHYHITSLTPRSPPPTSLTSLTVVVGLMVSAPGAACLL